MFLSEIIYWSFIQQELEKLDVTLEQYHRDTAVVVSGTGQPMLDQQIKMCRYPKRDLRYIDIRHCDVLTGAYATEGMKRAKTEMKMARRTIPSPTQSEHVLGNKVKYERADTQYLFEVSETNVLIGEIFHAEKASHVG